MNDVGKKPAWLMTGQKWEKFQARVPGDSFQNGMELERAGNSLPQKNTQGMLDTEERRQPRNSEYEEIRSLALGWQAWKSK